MWGAHCRLFLNSWTPCIQSPTSSYKRLSGSLQYLLKGLSEKKHQGSSRTWPAKTFEVLDIPGNTTICSFNLTILQYYLGAKTPRRQGVKFSVGAGAASRSGEQTFEDRYLMEQTSSFWGVVVLIFDIAVQKRITCAPLRYIFTDPIFCAQGCCSLTRGRSYCSTATCWILAS